MKKLFMIAAAAATVLATGCVKNNNETDQTRIVVRLNGASIAPETRAVEAPATETATGSKAAAVTLTRAWIYVISSEGVYSELMDLEAAKDSGDLIGEEGQLFPSDSRVYVLGNWPGSVIPADLDSWPKIEEKVVEITSDIDYTRPVLANATGAPVGVTVDAVDEGAQLLMDAGLPLHRLALLVAHRRLGRLRAGLPVRRTDGAGGVGALWGG